MSDINKPGAYVVEFYSGDPEGPIYAGIHKGAAGFAHTLASAQLFETAEAAQRTLENAYGKSTAAIGTVKGLRVGPATASARKKDN